MTRPVNLYTLSRIRGEAAFNTVEQHVSQKKIGSKTKYHEIESLRILVNALFRAGVDVQEFDGFYLGYIIPRIGKEFDLLKFTDNACLNIELKSTPIPEEEILAQLKKNRYYLGHLGKRLSLYTVVTNTLTCYRLSLNSELTPVDFAEVVSAVKSVGGPGSGDIDLLFRASNYLVSPFSHPDRFIQGEYFLTQAQNLIKRALLKHMDACFTASFFHITGQAGTGKTLLLYDIAKTLSHSGKTLLIHCGGPLSGSQQELNQRLENLDIVCAQDLRQDGGVLLSAGRYSFILADEAQRLSVPLFQALCASVRENRQVCIFSTDPEQILTQEERENNIPGRIQALELKENFTLSEKIRANREINAFILSMMNRNYRPKTPMDYADIALNYAETTQEAQNILGYYRQNGYKVISFAAADYSADPYAEFEEDLDVRQTIGLEFDDVALLLDKRFVYGKDGELCGPADFDAQSMYPNLFYQGITRVREHLALIVVDAPDLFDEIVSIVQE